LRGHNLDASKKIFVAAGILVFDFELFIGERVEETNRWPLRHVTRACKTVGWPRSISILPWIGFFARQTPPFLSSQRHLVTISVMKTPFKVIEADPCSYRRRDICQ
jgi:hypothetical protein